MSGFDVSKYRDLFVREARGHVAALRDAAGQLPSGSVPIDEVFRRFHSLKGMSLAIGYRRIAEVAHAGEDLLDALRVRDIEPDAALRAALDEAIGTIDALVGRIADQKAGDVDLNPLYDRLSALGVRRTGSSAARATLARAGEAAPDIVQHVSRRPSPVRAPPSRDVEPLVLETGAEDEVPRTIIEAADSMRRSWRTSGRSTSHGAGRGALPPAPPDATLPPNRIPVPQLGVAAGHDAARSPALPPEPPPTSDSSVEPPRARPVPGVTAALAAGRPTTLVTSPTLTGLARARGADGAWLDAFVDALDELEMASDYLAAEARAAPDQPGFARLRAGVERLERSAARLRSEVAGARQVPVAVLVEPVQRLADDLARRLSRTVEVEVQSSETRLDRALVERLSAPLAQLVSNCVVHGIEAPEEREAIGKAPAGRLCFRARREAGRVVLELEDDGRGIDARAVRDQAVERGLVSPERAAAMPERDWLQLICVEGYSTASGVSTVSGRGVGMGAARAQIDALGGALTIVSRVGAGTCFVIKLPETLVVRSALVVEQGQTVWAIPMTHVACTSALRDSRVPDEPSRARIATTVVPIVSFATLLGQEPLRGRDAEPEPVRPDETPLVFVSANDGRGAPRAAVIVDRIIGQQELGVHSDRVDGASRRSSVEGLRAATLLRDARACAVIDIGRLVDRWFEARRT